MSTDVQPLVFEKIIHAPISQTYLAFTNSSRLREWMCDVATTDPKPNGRFYLAWNSGFYGCGHFTQLEKDHLVGFTWYGRDEPHSTQVTVVLTPHEKGVRVRLEHSGLGEGPEWEDPRKNFCRGWESGLENLVSILETGQDQRIIHRPMLGIQLGDFNAEMAEKLGLPVTEGIRLTGVVQGMGAEAAGLQGNDVIVQIGRFPVPDYNALGNAIQSYSAGDDVEVTYYRGSKKQKTLMKLSSRPIPQLPGTPEALAKLVESTYTNIRQQLEEIFKDTSEELASQSPAEGEWSAKKALAHLIHSERGLHNYFQELVGAYEPIYDGYQNIPARLIATLRVFPTTQVLLTELFCLMQETVSFLEVLPGSFVESKSAYWRLAYNASNLHFHFNDHLEQIRRSLKVSSGLSQ
jgi:uncharacterized protein YndB with AHSA1/START domain